jgi:hypothetical protein
MPRRPIASVTSQMKPLELSMPVAAAVTYVLRACSEPICIAITPSRVSVRAASIHFSFSADSWFLGPRPVGGGF